MFGDQSNSRKGAAIRGRGRPHEGVAHRASNDHLHQFAGVGVARLNCRQPAPVAKNRHSIGNAQYLVQTVGDVNDADIVGAQPPERLEQPLDVGLGKRRRRLIENDNVRSDRQRSADRNKRALGCGKRGDRHVRIEVAAHDCERLRGSIFHFGPRYEARPRPRMAGLNRDVLGNRHPFDQPEILVDEGDWQRIFSRLSRPSSNTISPESAS